MTTNPELNWDWFSKGLAWRVALVKRIAPDLDSVKVLELARRLLANDEDESLAVTLYLAMTPWRSQESLTRYRSKMDTAQYHVLLID